MIDLHQKVMFHADHASAQASLDDALIMTGVLFEDSHMALVNAQFAEDGKNHVVLFDKERRSVLTENFMFWSACNA